MSDSKLDRFGGRLHRFTPEDRIAFWARMPVPERQARARKMREARWGTGPHRYVIVAEHLKTMSYAETAAEMGTTIERVWALANLARRNGLEVPPKRQSIPIETRQGYAKLGNEARARLKEKWPANIDGPRTQCTCGLTLDDDHKAEDCDLRSGAAGRIRTASNGGWMSPRSEGG